MFQEKEEKVDKQDKDVADSMMDELEALMNSAKSSYVYTNMIIISIFCLK